MKKKEEYVLYGIFSAQSIHFRKKKDSVMESFSISYLADGTCILSGDFEVLVWKRDYWPKKKDFGFPYKDTGIGYFAEKVVLAHGRQQIREWDAERAKKEIEEYFIENYKETMDSQDKIVEHVTQYYFPSNVVKISKKAKEFLDELSFSYEQGPAGQTEMYQELNNFEESSWYEHSFGEDYTDQFKFQFQLLQSVSEKILDLTKRWDSEKESGKE